MDVVGWFELDAAAICALPPGSRLMRTGTAPALMIAAWASADGVASFARASESGTSAPRATMRSIISITMRYRSTTSDELDIALDCLPACEPLSVKELQRAMHKARDCGHETGRGANKKQSPDLTRAMRFEQKLEAEHGAYFAPPQVRAAQEEGFLARILLAEGQHAKPDEAIARLVGRLAH